MLRVRFACALFILLFARVSWCTPAVTLVHCMFHHEDDGSWTLIFGYPAIGRDFAPTETIRMATWIMGPVHSGACMRLAGTESDTLKVLTTEFRATKVNSVDADCGVNGKDVVMFNERGGRIARGESVEVRSHEPKTGREQAILHTYFMTHEQNSEDLTVFPMRYCRSLQPATREAPAPANVRIVL